MEVSGRNWIHSLFRKKKPALFSEEDGSVGAPPEYESRSSKIVTPGELVTTDLSFMCGHGTFMESEKILASVAGHVEVINKLIRVLPLKSRYIGEVGDVVVGRILKVSQKRWKVDLQAHQNANLQLSSIYLPGGVQRRKLEEDELQIREFFVEGDLLSAEVQAVHMDGSLSIHTRNIKYGKLFNGTFVCVQPRNVQRSRSHFHSLPCGVDLIVGMNGFIWIGLPQPPAKGDSQPNPYKIAQKERYTTARALHFAISGDLRETMARVRNCIKLLDRHCLPLTDTILADAYESSLEHSVPSIIFEDKIGSKIIQAVSIVARQRGF